VAAWRAGDWLEACRLQPLFALVWVVLWAAFALAVASLVSGRAWPAWRPSARFVRTALLLTGLAMLLQWAFLVLDGR
jgi:hypothetical protein